MSTLSPAPVSPSARRSASPAGAGGEPVYQSGFGNEFASEALPGALPVGQNSPQRCAYGLYAEQLSGTAFTAPRHANRRSWLYRIMPSAVQAPFEPLAHAGVEALERCSGTPDRLRWSAPPLPASGQVQDLLDGLMAMAGNGSPAGQSGAAIYRYAANRSMQRCFYSADGEWLVVPDTGRLRLETELGRLDVAPGEIAVVPRGMRWRARLLDEAARGYVCENYGQPWRLPDLGVIGANGLANARDFLAPVAWFEDVPRPQTVVAKYLGRLWQTELPHSPLDVVAWHGNLAPYKYDLRRFNTLGSVSYDHPDPSIFLVLQAPSDTPGVDTIDFVIFPERWLVAEHTFRPPWYHRNVASEFMGLVRGSYDAKAEGFLPGGASLHNCMSGHGPDADTFLAASREDTRAPRRVSDTLAFMFETQHPLQPTHAALALDTLQTDYARCWNGLPRQFHPDHR